jgi:hypothetical protein
MLNIAIMTGYLAWSSKRVSHLISTLPSIMTGIIIQIQASIASEAIDNLGEYEENTTEKQKDTNIQDRTQAPPQTKPQGWQVPISSHKAAKREASRGLVKISVNYLSVSMYLISMSPFPTWSLTKWCFLSRYLILLWKTNFFATEMALVLSQMRQSLSNITPKSHGVHNP